jgi:hypothetical protein
LAFHIVLDQIKYVDGECSDTELDMPFVPCEYKGPKAIGQIFGISYIYSLFWRWGLIAVPEKVKEKLKGK